MKHERHPQSQSRLFRLPPEIRQDIYEYILGSMTVHLMANVNPLKHCLCPNKGYMFHNICPRDSTGLSGTHCTSVGMQGPDEIQWRAPGEDRPELQRLAFLVTCQAVYV